MTTALHTTPTTRAPYYRNLGIALLAAVAFGASGTFATALHSSGWATGSTVSLRILGTAAILIIPAAILARSHTRTIAQHSGYLIGFGILAMGAAQFCFFQAMQYTHVGIALLIEYTGPVLVVGWLWLRRGQKPSRAILAGAAITLGGLALVMDIGSTNQVHPLGILWASGAAIGLAGYFLLGANNTSGLPTVITITAGSLVAGGTLLGLGLLGILPLAMTTNHVDLAGNHYPWWVAALGLVVISGAFAYLTGIISTKNLGSRPAAFVGYAEVLFAILIAAVVLGQRPSLSQALGGAILLCGIAVVQWGETSE